MLKNSPFIISGPLTKENAGIYITRDADAQVVSLLLKMEYVSLAEPYQQGQTSLIYHLSSYGSLSNYIFLHTKFPDASRTSKQWYKMLGEGLRDRLQKWPQYKPIALPKNSWGW